MLKRLVAMPGDDISIDATGVSVAGNAVPNSVPMDADHAGRALPVCRLQHYRLRRGDVLVMSDYSALSFDARYFGPIPASASGRSWCRYGPGKAPRMLGCSRLIKNQCLFFIQNGSI
jgi:type IV secretory pathway protease TraF